MSISVIPRQGMEARRAETNVTGEQRRPCVGLGSREPGPRQRRRAFLVDYTPGLNPQFEKLYGSDTPHN